MARKCQHNLAICYERKARTWWGNGGDGGAGNAHGGAVVGLGTHTAARRGSGERTRRGGGELGTHTAGLAAERGTHMAGRRRGGARTWQGGDGLGTHTAGRQWGRERTRRG